MPRGRKRKDASTAGSDIIAPGAGTAKDISNLSRTLGLPQDAVRAIMTCQGNGVRSRRSAAAAGNNAATGGQAFPGVMGMMMPSGAGGDAGNVWGDFLSEEMPPATSSDDTDKSSPSAPGVGNGGPKAKGNDSGRSSRSATTAQKKNETEVSSANTVDTSGPRSYVLPIRPRFRVAKGAKKASEGGDDHDEHLVPTPGILAQTGTLDVSIVGRSKLGSGTQPQDLNMPTILFPKSLLAKVKFALIAASPSSCHNIAVDVNGVPYGWGRNETSQLGRGYSSSNVVMPTVLTLPESDTVVGAAVGKYHSLLVGKSGKVYASGSNKCGQCGVGSSIEMVDKFRKCAIVGGLGYKKRKGDEDVADGFAARIVQAACGENFSALLSTSGHLYTAGLSEFGQLANGETGEYFVTASKLAFANAHKFERRSNFVQSESDAAVASGGSRTSLMTDNVDSGGRVKTVPLEDASDICLGSISCGKNHAIVIEAFAKPQGGKVPSPRVFTWGSGSYGCLGHAIQADEYTPRLIGTFRGPLFTSNYPVAAVAGAHCSIVRTKHGHVYFCGKTRSVGEATMRPTLVDALANNGHKVIAMGAGSQSVVCSTDDGVTVGWGKASFGELGFGADRKSSSKPEFINCLDTCLVTEIACGMGNALFLLQNEDEDDNKALAKVPELEKADIALFAKEAVNKKFSGAVGDADELRSGGAMPVGEPTTKKRPRKKLKSQS